MKDTPGLATEEARVDRRMRETKEERAELERKVVQLQRQVEKLALVEAGEDEEPKVEKVKVAAIFRCTDIRYRKKSARKSCYF